MNDPHILGTERIGKLLVQYPTPAIIGMTVTPLCNTVDSIFIGCGAGTMGIAGFAITFPLVNLVTALYTLASAGGSATSSIRLGRKGMDGVAEVLNNTLMLYPANLFLFGNIPLFLLDETLRFFRTNNDALPYAKDFMQVILLGTPITYAIIELNSVIRATGYSKKAILTLIVTAVCNIILTPVLIFHFDWGIHGTATATVTSQFIGIV